MAKKSTKMFRGAVFVDAASDKDDLTAMGVKVGPYDKGRKAFLRCTVPSGVLVDIEDSGFSYMLRVK